MLLPSQLFVPLRSQHKHVVKFVKACKHRAKNDQKVKRLGCCSLFLNVQEGNGDASAHPSLTGTLLSRKIVAYIFDEAEHRIFLLRDLHVRLSFGPSHEGCPGPLDVFLAPGKLFEINLN